jgi:fibronectin type 3 domain-containing protein
VDSHPGQDHPVKKNFMTTSAEGLIRRRFVAAAAILLALLPVAHAQSVNPDLSQHFVSLSWTASRSSNVVSYNVYRSAISGGPYALLASQLAVTTYDDISVENGFTYYYVTTAVDNTGAESTFSNEAQVSLGFSQHPVSLFWTASTSGNVVSYNIYRSAASGGPYALIASQIIGTSYDDTSVQNGLSYYYVTTSIDNTGAESAYSNEAQATIPSQ